MNERRKNNLLQELTNVLAVLLPLAQVSFVYLPDSLKGLFLSQDTFLSVSLITLLMSYVSLIAYKARPWSTIVLPIHRKQMKKYNDWQQEIFQINDEINKISNDYLQHNRLSKLRSKLDKLLSKNIKQPYQINSENRVGVLLTLLLINAIIFLVIGLSTTNHIWSTVQSISYFFLNNTIGTYSSNLSRFI
jgi:hypothetical protein